MLCLGDRVHLTVRRLRHLRDGLGDALCGVRRLLRRIRQGARGIGDGLCRLLDGFRHRADVFEHLIRLVRHLGELIPRIRRQMDAEITLRDLAQIREHHVNRTRYGAQQDKSARTGQEKDDDYGDDGRRDDAIIDGSTVIV